MKEYNSVTLNGDIPKTLKLILLCIDRVGFPILAFCLMFWMSYSSLDKVTASLTENTSALVELRTATYEFHKTVNLEHKYMAGKLDRISE